MINVCLELRSLTILNPNTGWMQIQLVLPEDKGRDGAYTQKEIWIDTHQLRLLLIGIPKKKKTRIGIVMCKASIGHVMLKSPEIKIF